MLFKDLSFFDIFLEYGWTDRPTNLALEAPYRSLIKYVDLISPKNKYSVHEEMVRHFGVTTSD